MSTALPTPELAQDAARCSFAPVTGSAFRSYYEDAHVKLYLGDCREILPSLDIEPVVLVTDPPYSSGGFQESGKSGGSLTGRHKERGESIALDNLSTRGYQRLMREVLRSCWTVDEAYIFTDWRMWIHTSDALEDGGWRVRNMLVWDKGQMGMGMPWRNPFPAWPAPWPAHA